MADTIITNVPNLKDNESNTLGGTMMVILAVAFLVGIAFLYRTEIFQAITPAPVEKTTNVNVVVPTPPTPQPVVPATADAQ